MTPHEHAEVNVLTGMEAERERLPVYGVLQQLPEQGARAHQQRCGSARQGGRVGCPANAGQHDGCPQERNHPPEVRRSQECV
jgi:hypothetical protein